MEPKVSNPAEPAESASSLDSFLPPQMPGGGEGHAPDSHPPTQQNTVVRLYHQLVSHPKSSLAALLLIVAAPAGGYYGYDNYYSWHLHSTALVAYEERDYELVIEKLEEYNLRRPQDLDTALFLVMVHMQSGDHASATEVIDSVLTANVSDVQQKHGYYYLALISMLEGDMDAASQHLRKVSLNDAVYPPAFYMRGMLQLYGEGDFVSARGSLEGAIEKLQALNDPARVEEANLYIDLARRMWGRQHQNNLKLSPALSFERLAKSPGFSSALAVHGFPFSMPVDAFNNTYYVPSSRSVLLEERLDAVENTYLLLAEVAMRQGEFAAAEEYLDALTQIKRDAIAPNSLRHMYFNALLAVSEGNYLNAADYYSRIDDREASVDARVMLASARWAAGKGALPGEKILGVYDKALRLQPQNLIALVNRAYLHLVLGEADKAAPLLETAHEVHGRNFHVLYNFALLDIVRGDLIRAQDDLQELLASGYDSTELTSVLTYALLAGGGGESDLIPALQKLKANDRITPATYLILADLYRRRDQPLLAVAELLAGRKQFPGDKNLLFELMLEYANQQEVAKYAALKEIVSDADFQADYRTWLAEALTSASVSDAGLAFQQALLVAEEIGQKENVLQRWLRYLQSEGEAARAAEVARRVDRLYEQSGGKPPLSLRMLQIWGGVSAANIAQRKRMVAEVVQQLDEDVHHPPDVQEDIAYALAALGDKRQAMKILEPLAKSHGSKRNLQLLLWVYENLGVEDAGKIAEVNRRMEAIGVQEIAVSEKQEFLRTAEAIQDAGLAVARSGKKELSGVALSGDDQYSDVINLALAEQDYERAIAIYSELLVDTEAGYTPALVYQNRGVLYLKIKDYEQALQDFDNALAQQGIDEDDRNSVLYNQSLALIGMKRYEEARTVLAQLVENTGDNLRNLVLYAQVLHGFNDSNAIMPIYERIIRLSPEQISFYVRLADVYNKLERTGDAFDILRAGLRVDPNNIDLHRTIAKLYALNGNQQKAQEHLQVVRNL